VENKLAEVRLNLVLPVRAESFASAARRKLAVLTTNADVLAGRSLAAYCYVLGDMRSIAPFPACLRRIQIAERNEAEREQAGMGRVVTRREVK
jgi:hypothetical protein